MLSGLFPAETLWFQLPPEHCLHRGERVLRALLLLWHERYVAMSRKRLVHRWAFVHTSLVFRGCVVCGHGCLSK